MANYTIQNGQTIYDVALQNFGDLAYLKNVLELYTDLDVDPTPGSVITLTPEVNPVTNFYTDKEMKVVSSVVPPKEQTFFKDSLLCGATTHLVNTNVAGRTWPANGYFELWFRHSERKAATDTFIFHNNTSPAGISDGDLGVYISSFNNLNFIQNDVSTLELLSNSLPTSGSHKRHVLITWQGSTIEWYINGSLLKTTNSWSDMADVFKDGIFFNKDNTSGDLKIALFSWRHGEVYLDSDAVAALYNSGQQGQAPAATPLIEYIFADNLSGNNVLDTGSLGEDLTIQSPGEFSIHDFDTDLTEAWP